MRNSDTYVIYFAIRHARSIGRRCKRFYVRPTGALNNSHCATRFLTLAHANAVADKLSAKYVRVGYTVVTCNVTPFYHYDCEVSGW